jgi:hypothetical protein
VLQVSVLTRRELTEKIHTYLFQTIDALLYT